MVAAFDSSERFWILPLDSSVDNPNHSNKLLPPVIADMVSRSSSLLTDRSLIIRVVISVLLKEFEDAATALSIRREVVRAVPPCFPYQDVVQRDAFQRDAVELGAVRATHPVRAVQLVVLLRLPHPDVQGHG